MIKNLLKAFKAVQPSEKLHLDYLFILILISFCLIYIFIIPPIENPDEPAHLFRAYGIAEGQLVLKNHPRELVEFVQENMLRHVKFYEATGDILKKEKNSRIPNLAFTTAIYSPIPYLGYSVLIKLVTLNKTSTPSKFQLITAFYLSRFFSLSLFIGLLFYIVKTSSLLKWPVIWISSTPMVLTQATAVNIDIVIFASSIIILNLSIQQVKSWSNIWAIIIMTLILMMSKPVYTPILIIPLISLIISNTTYKLTKILLLCVGCMLTLLPALFWNNYIKTNGILSHFINVGAILGFTNANPIIQLEQIISNPFGFINVIVNTIISDGKALYHQFVGVLSWLDIPIPFWTVVLWAFAAIASLFIKETIEVPNKKFLLGTSCIIAAFLCSFMVMLSAYLLWMGVGADIIWLQGRYFHVIGTVFMLGISLYIPPMLSLANQKRIKWTLLITALVINITTILTLFEKFWI